MHPVLTTLQWGGHSRVLGSYGLCLGLAVLAGGGLSLRGALRAGLDAGAMIAALGSAVLVGFAGAYSLFVIVSCVQGLPLMAAITQPGIVFYGGALGAFAGFCVSARLLGLPVTPALDAAAPALPLAHAIGRVGCFLGGCCYGAPSAHFWAVTYLDPMAPAAHPPVPRHPWPLYEAAALLVLAWVLARAPSRKFAPGHRFAAYVAAYALLRFALEPLRGDMVRGVFFGALSTSQLVAALTLLAALVFARAPARCT